MNVIEKSFARFEAEKDPVLKHLHILTYFSLRHDRSVSCLWFVIIIQMIMIIVLYAKAN